MSLGVEQCILQLTEFFALCGHFATFFFQKHILPKHLQVYNLYKLQAPQKLLKQPLSNLVEYLVEDYHDDLSKIRVIYRWVTAQPVDSMKIPNREPSQSHTLFQLWRIRHRKGNYAQLISLLCRYKVFCYIRLPILILRFIFFKYRETCG